MKTFFYSLPLLLATLCCVPTASLADDAFVRVPPVLVDDALMPSQGAIDATANWVRCAFAGEKPELVATPGSCLIDVERQDYSRLRFNETCIGRNFEFARGVSFVRGLGTHSFSRLRVLFPEKISKFHAFAGIAENAGGGSVRFHVESQGQTLWSSDVLRLNDEPVEVDVTFEPAVDEFTLVVDDADDGPTCDQGNWLVPVAETPKGRFYNLVDDAVVARFEPEVPFSFKYNGVSSREFLKSWTFEAKRVDDLNDVFSWTDPETKLTVSAEVRRFEKFAAVDWVLRFTNGGTGDSGLIEDVQALDAGFYYGFERTDLAVHTLTGDSCDENSWLPTIRDISPGAVESFAPQGGRSSNGAFPFWNVMSRRRADSETSEGFFVALGWTGQWNASFENVDDPRSLATVRAGMEKISTILYPNESFRSPRVLLMPWRGDRLSSQALFRRLLMFEYVPKIEGSPVQLEFLGQCFDRYYRKRPNWEKAPAQIESAKLVKKIGGTCYWFDAAWFPVGFPNGVGNWFSDLANFPNGVEELGDALKEMGLKFVLWFEPERVAAGTEIATQHAEYVYGGEEGGLYKLGDPEAREFLVDLMLRRIKEFKIDVFRTDFNIEPLPFWRAADEPNRVGMTEIRHVEGLYEMWDRIRDENPGLWIDNCASGGRRIDLETISRAVPLWRSDTCCWPGHPEWDQNQTLGLTQYLPLFSCAAWDPSPYVFRSGANPGAIMQFNFLDDNFNEPLARAALAEAKENSKYWYGDFYPLTEVKKGTSSIAAWQLDRPDLNSGLVYLFRQTDSPYVGIELELRGIDPRARYSVGFKRDGYDFEKSGEFNGVELKNVMILLEEKGSTILLRYTKL
ncbi:MAG: alpha-galactosidase [Thermoguttaceae bacterium]|jgi:alpha-galactosidase